MYPFITLQAISVHMAKNIKFSDIIMSDENFKNSGECTVWIEKLELVAQLQGVTEMLKFVPLFLIRHVSATSRL